MSSTAFYEATKHPPCLKNVFSPDKRQFLYQEISRGNGYAGGFCSLARNYQRVEVGKAKSQGGPAARVTLCVLVMVGRLEGTDRLAHERKIAGERTDGEYEWLIRIVPWFLRMSIGAEQVSCKAAATNKRVSAVHGYYFSSTSAKVNCKYSEVFPDHAAPPSSVDPMICTSLISRQS